MKKIVTILTAAALLLSVVAACKKSEPAKAADAGKAAAPAAKIKIAVSFFDFANTYLSYMRGGMKAFEPTLGADVKVEYIDAKNDQPTQNDQIDTLIAKGINVLCVNPVDPKAASTIINKVKA